MNQPTNLQISGLSYLDWEEEAAQLRRAAESKRRISKRHLSRVRQLLDDLEAELDSIEGVVAGLSGFDSVRVQCTRDLVVALRAGLFETLRRMEARRRDAAPALA